MGGAGRFCSKCGKQMDFRLGEYVCPNCGYAVAAGAAAPPVPKQQASFQPGQGAGQAWSGTPDEKQAVSSWQRTELPGFEVPPSPDELPRSRSAVPMAGEKRAFLGVGAFIMIVLQVFVSLAESDNIDHSREDTVILSVAGGLLIVALLALYALALFIKERGVKFGLMVFNGLCIIVGVAFAVGLIIEEPFVMQIYLDTNLWGVPKPYCIAFLFVHAAVMAWLVQILYQDATGHATGQ